MGVGGNNNQNLRPIPKGTVLNPLGAGAHKTLHGPIRKLTNDQVAELATMILEKDIPELEKVWASKKTTALQKMTVAVVLEVIKKRDVNGWATILDRICGKPKETKVHEVGETLESLILLSKQKKPEQEVRDVNALPLVSDGVSSVINVDSDDEFLK